MEPALSWTASTEEEQLTDPPGNWVTRDPTYPLTEPMPGDANLMFGLPYGGANLELNMWNAPTGAEGLGGYMGGYDEQYMY